MVKESLNLNNLRTEVTVEKKAIDLTTLATEALKAHEVTAAQGTSQSAQDTSTIKSSTPDLDTHPADREDVKLTTTASPASELPPIRQHSPKSGLSNSTGAGLVTLPSISDQLGDLNRLAEAAVAGVSTFSQSLTRRPPPRLSAVPGQGSPPKSPNDTVRRELPSPGRHAVRYDYNANSHRRASQSDSPQYASAGYRRSPRDRADPGGIERGLPDYLKFVQTQRWSCNWIITRSINQKGCLQ
jgi:hypothetical protein